MLTASGLAEQGFSGVHCGMYRVAVTKNGLDGKESVPAKYNTETTLGLEVAPDVPARNGGRC